MFHNKCTNLSRGGCLLFRISLCCPVPTGLQGQGEEKPYEAEMNPKPKEIQHGHETQGLNFSSPGKALGNLVAVPPPQLCATVPTLVVLAFLEFL